jgi:hypothetical protein
MVLEKKQSVDVGNNYGYDLEDVFVNTERLSASQYDNAARK